MLTHTNSTRERYITKDQTLKTLQGNTNLGELNAHLHLAGSSQAWHWWEAPAAPGCLVLCPAAWLAMVNPHLNGLDCNFGSACPLTVGYIFWNHSLMKDCFLPRTHGSAGSEAQGWRFYLGSGLGSRPSGSSSQGSLICPCFDLGSGSLALEYHCGVGIPGHRCPWGSQSPGHSVCFGCLRGSSWTGYSHGCPCLGREDAWGQ